MSDIEEATVSLRDQLTISAEEPADWFDMTKEFSSIVETLDRGEMIHAKDFNLFDSMSALELMDRKMDSGMHVDDMAFLPPLDRMRQSLIPLEFTSLSDVLSTIDELCCCESSWLQGQPLFQSLLTCLYLHADIMKELLKKISDKHEVSREITFVEEKVSSEDRHKDVLYLVMCAMSVAVLKTCSLFREIVLKADIYEEEDLSPNSFDMTMVGSISDDFFLQLLGATERRLEAALLISSRKKNRKKGVQTSNQPHNQLSDSSNEMSKDILDSFLRRIRYRKTLYSAFSLLGQGQDALDLESASLKLSEAQSLLEAIKIEELERTHSGRGSLLGFDRNVGLLLSSCSPPRELKLLGFQESIDVHSNLLMDMMSICKPPKFEGLDDLRSSLSQFSRRNPNIIARSYALLFLYIDKQIYGRYNFVTWLSDSMVTNGVPSVLLSTQEGMMFSSHAIEAVYESIKVHLHRRSRQRSRLEYLLEEWALLEIEATTIDDTFVTQMGIAKSPHPRYFTAWVLEQVVQLMMHYLNLGFELELYSISEYRMIYWYMDYLIGSRMQNLNFIRAFVQRLKEMTVRETDKIVHKEMVDQEIHLSEVYRAAARAYFQLFVALDCEGLVQNSDPLYRTQTTSFLCRFKPFQLLHFPAPLSYDDLKKNIDFAEFEVDVIFKSAVECFKAMRAYGDKASSLQMSDMVQDEIRSLILLSISNCVNIVKYLETRHQLRDKACLSFSFSIHPHFPVVSFVESYKSPS